MQSQSVEIVSKASDLWCLLRMSREDDGQQTWESLSPDGLQIGSRAGVWSYRPDSSLIAFRDAPGGDPLMVFENVPLDFLGAFCTRIYRGDGSLVSNYAAREAVSWTIGAGCV